MPVVRSLGEQLSRGRRPVVCGRDRQLLLALEVVEEAALGHPRRAADVLEARRRVALRTDNRERGIEEFRLGWMKCVGHVAPNPLVGLFIPTSGYVVQGKWYGPLEIRSGERRVGEECVRQCRF